MIASPEFQQQKKHFWAYVRTLSQSLGYTGAAGKGSGSRGVRRGNGHGRRTAAASTECRGRRKSDGRETASVQPNASSGRGGSF